jgi:cell division septal protein FtsQ
LAARLAFHRGVSPPRSTDVGVTRVDVQHPPRAGRPRQATRESPRRGLLRRRRNRRITVAQASVTVWVGEALRVAAGKLVILGKALAAVAFLAGAAYGGQRAVRHVIASPRFAVREVRVAPTTHVREEEVLALAAVNAGDKLLAIDTDAVAARVATHPWVASVRVRRELPSALAIDVTERRAAAAALLGALYLLDGGGHPFKRATLDEADGLPVITGIAREHYTGYRAATEAAFREGLALLETYQAEDALAPARPRAGSGKRPALSEVHIDPRLGFSLVLFDGGGEIRLGRGEWPEKLARLDEILAALGPRGPAALRTVHLDGPTHDRVAVRLAPIPAPPVGRDEPAPPSKKFRSSPKHSED